MKKGRAHTKTLAMLLALLGMSIQVLADESGTAAGEASEEPGEKRSHFEETVVVTASRTEQRLEDVPASMTVLGSEQIVTAPADDIGDLLRTVPGLNVSQASARDFSVSARRATAAIAGGQLAMIDNVSIYQDFNGQTLWDTVPLDPREIEQIEVVRGPASAVWGANAVDGVINIITKDPKDIVGTSATLGFGELHSRYANATHADVFGKWSYKVSAGWIEQDAYDRPEGIIPDTEGPTNPGGTPYPEYTNRRMHQQRYNVRVDYDQDDETTWSVAAGYAGIDGMWLTPGGPYDVDGSDSYYQYARLDWRRRAARVTFSVDNLEIGGGFAPLSGDSFLADNATYNLDFIDTRLAGDRHLLTYGVNLRQGTYDLEGAPDAPDRDYYGVFLQDEILTRPQSSSHSLC